MHPVPIPIENKVSKKVTTDSSPPSMFFPYPGRMVIIAAP